ncbi:hypothetical protein QTI05_24215 [Variovorax sp. J22R193]|uniref:hypothetical protein n=1 Tax=Variovorax fucosicus TaxID=3053517 RepID=UPI00257892CC|nr:hypothetical protein [Variovorax sp. J22R193]MDM0042165.1 hypothetical protein [Variovorax sp. J22R193]
MDNSTATWLQVIAAVASAIAAGAAAWAAHRQHNATLMQTEFTLIEKRREVYERLTTLINRVLFDETDFRNNGFMDEFDLIAKDLNYYFSESVVAWVDTDLRALVINRLVTVSKLQDETVKQQRTVEGGLEQTTRHAFWALTFAFNGVYGMHFLPEVSAEMIRRKYNQTLLSKILTWLVRKYKGAAQIFATGIQRVRKIKIGRT